MNLKEMGKAWTGITTFWKGNTYWKT